MDKDRVAVSRPLPTSGEEGEAGEVSRAVALGDSAAVYRSAGSSFPLLTGGKGIPLR